MFKASQFLSVQIGISNACVAKHRDVISDWDSWISDSLNATGYQSIGSECQKCADMISIPLRQLVSYISVVQLLLCCPRGKKCYAVNCV